MPSIAQTKKRVTSRSTSDSHNRNEQLMMSRMALEWESRSNLKYPVL